MRRLRRWFVAKVVALPPSALATWALVELFGRYFPARPWTDLALLCVVWFLMAVALWQALRMLKRRRHRRGGGPRRTHLNKRQRLHPAGHPWVLDTSLVIDGRIADVADTGLFDAPLVVGQFVIDELQSIADSSDKLRRARGRRGLDVLNRLKSNPRIDLVIDDRELREYAEQTVDRKLVLLAKDLGGRVATHDFNLNKVAKLHGVGVLNLNEVAAALRPVCLPGEMLSVQIIRVGEQPGQGVGYLDDGTMVVVEGGHDHVQQQISLRVTSVTQSSAGRMIFGRYETVVAE